MGEFLSTPIKDKITHDDENSFVIIILFILKNNKKIQQKTI